MQSVSIVQGLWATYIMAFPFNAHETTIMIEDIFGYETLTMKSH